jgi:hypothetical protein
MRSAPATSQRATASTVRRPASSPAAADRRSLRLARSAALQGSLYRFGGTL